MIEATFARIIRRFDRSTDHPYRNPTLMLVLSIAVQLAVEDRASRVLIIRGPR